MQKPQSLVEALEASMVVQAQFEGAKGDAQAWHEWEDALFEKALAVPWNEREWEKLLTLCDLLEDRDTFTDGNEEIHVLAIEDGYVVWDTIVGTEIRVLAGIAVDMALHDAPQYEYAPPGTDYDGFLVTGEAS